MKYTFQLPKVSGLEGVALLLGMGLSLACLTRGAVYDFSVALLLMLLLPLAIVAVRQNRVVHAGLQKTGWLMLAVLCVVALLQTLFLEKTLQPAAWMASIGRILVLVLVYYLALVLGAAEATARLFLNTLLAGGAMCVATTFFLATAEGVPTSPLFTYSHGLINVNHAATYIGMLFLLALAQAARIVRKVRFSPQRLPDFIDQLSIVAVIEGLLLLATLILCIAALFMTASRGGIVLSLFSAFVFGVILLQKMHVRLQRRKWLVLLVSVLMFSLLFWSFLNYGKIFQDALEREGVDHHSRIEVYRATIPMIADHWKLGTGLGSFAQVFQQYRPADISADGIIDKAHNSFLELATEMGLPAVLLLSAGLFAIGAMLLQGIYNRSERFIYPALGFSIWLLAVLHSMIDFPMQIPAIGAVALAMVVVCASQTDPRFSQPMSGGNGKEARRVRVRVRKRHKKHPI